MSSRRSFDLVSLVLCVCIVLAVASLGSGCTTFLPSPTKIDETETSRTPLDSPRLMTEEISEVQASASSEVDENDPSRGRELTGSIDGVTRTYQRFVQRVELDVEEKWRSGYSGWGYALDGTGAAFFGFVGVAGVVGGFSDMNDDASTGNIAVGAISLAAAGAFGYSIYAGLADSGEVETRRETRKLWVDASGCEGGTLSNSDR